MKKKTIEKINITTSVSAIIIAIISLAFSYYSYKDGQTEKVNIIANYVYGDYQTKILKVSDQVVIPLYWEIMVRNNGEKTMSITDFSIENKNATLYVSHLFDGLFLHFEDFDDNKIELPLIINSGESKKIYMRIGILCSKEASAILEKKNELSSELFQNGKWINPQEIKEQLAENNMDFFGNKVKTEYDDGKIVLMETETKTQPEFKIIFKTGKNTTFERYLYTYMGKE